LALAIQAKKASIGQALGSHSLRGTPTTPPSLTHTATV